MAKAKKATKAKATKTAEKVAAKTETQAEKATAMLRKGVLAYVGMYGAAYERAQTRFNEAREATDGLFDTLVEKGEEIETQATEYFKDTQSKVSKRYEENAKKVRSILPTSANDRVEELEAEIASLNKKIVSISKKVRPAIKAKTEKTMAAAAKTVEDVAEKVAEKAGEKAA